MCPVMSSVDRVLYSRSTARLLWQLGVVGEGEWVRNLPIQRTTRHADAVLIIVGVSGIV